MKAVLILGAGMVARPMVKYLLDKDYRVTVASRTKTKADQLIAGHKYGQSLAWTVEEKERLKELIRDHDIVVSLLPYAYHVTVAKLCISSKKSLVTTSYVSEDMQAIESDARNAGVILLNEIGLDPGIDHMSAKRIIDHVHRQQGEVLEFHSFTGALVAPEGRDNPFNYKFTWAPRGVMMAGNNAATYLKNGRQVDVPADRLFRDPIRVNVPEIGNMEVYPNRDSLKYKDLYNIPETRTLLRGTFRYEPWCEIMDAFKRLKLFSIDEIEVNNGSPADLLASLLGAGRTESLPDLVQQTLHAGTGSAAFRAMEWIGLFSDKPIGRDKISPLELVSGLMIGRMMIQDEERDMVVMQHNFLVRYPGKNPEVIISELIDFGSPAKDTSVARTVSLPAACAVELILEHKITASGVHIPVTAEIYQPILDSLEKMGIKMNEKFGLPESMHVI